MTIRNDILELVWEVGSATEFMRKCPLTLVGIQKAIFEDFEQDKMIYENYCSENDCKVNEYSLFDFLNNDWGLSDMEVIEIILKQEKEDYLISFEIDENQYETKWKIYKIKGDWENE